MLAAIADGRVPGVCLFAFNFRDLEQFGALTESLRVAAREGGQPPPLIGIDQEGGQLMAIAGGATELPGNMALGATRSVMLARAAGRILGSELNSLGINLNFAPVLDLATRPANPVVGLRAFGDDPELVAELGAAMIEGMQAEGVLACAKHFPGHGDTATDSHHAGASVDKSYEELRALELRPFVAAFEVGLAAVMTAHVRYPHLEDVPATFSPIVLTDLLRKNLHYGGLSITDALDMNALAEVAPERRARRALEAGADLALLGHLPGQQAIVEELAVMSFPASGRRVAATRAALAESKASGVGTPLGIESASAGLLARTLGWPRHAVEARTMAQAAITIVSGHEELPLRLGARDRLCLVSVTAGNLTPAETVSGGSGQLAEQVGRRHADLVATEFPFGAMAASSDGHIDEKIEAVLSTCRGAHTVLLATIDAAADSGQQRLFARLLERGHRPLVLAMRSPADAAVLTGARVMLCSYGRRQEQTDAAVAVLFGERPATGTLPIDLASLVEPSLSEGVTA